MLLFLLLWLLVWCGWMPCASWAQEGRRRRFQGMEQSRDVTVWNESGRKVDVFWVNVETGQTDASQTSGEGVAFGATNHINSYIGHTFEIQELPNPLTFQCLNSKPCRKAQFTVSSNEDQVFTVWKNFTVTVQDNKSLALDKAKKTLDECLQSYNLATDPIEALTRCMDEKIQQTLKETQEEIEFQALIRQDMGRDLAKYSCLDANASTTESISNLTWTYYDPTTQESVDFVLQTLFETTESGAWLVEDFISLKQCEALQSYGESVPGSATRQSMPIIQLMLQIQQLIQAITEFSPKFGSDPNTAMLTRWQRQGVEMTTYPETCSSSSSSNSDASECRVKYDIDDDPRMEQHWIPDGTKGTLILACPPPHSSTQKAGGGLHFPRTGVHISASSQAAKGSIVWITHADGDSYMDEYLVCLPPTPDQTLTLWIEHMGSR